MAVENFTFTTGPASLPDIGFLSYNGCTFSPLFTTSVSGKVIKDEAHRTTKLMEYRLSVDGYVTAADTTFVGEPGIAQSISDMRSALLAQGGVINYSGRGFEFSSLAGDLAWGPIPELIEFQPLGGGMSAKVKWEVVFRIYEGRMGNHLPASNNSRAPSGSAGSKPLLQFNCETNLSYGEDYYSSMTVKGTMEIALARRSPTDRTLNTTVDDVRAELDERIFSGIDLSRFNVVRRDYNISRDKRTMLFDVAVEEKAYMDMPVYCTVARGSYNVRPAKSGPGLVLWMCTLRATYTIVADRPRRWAWVAFLALLKLRMGYSALANIPPAPNNPNQQNPNNPNAPVVVNRGRDILDIALFGVPIIAREGQRAIQRRFANQPEPPGAWLIDFSFDEGLYKDSKTITFSATWRMVTTLSHILLASGIWSKVPEEDAAGNSLWAASLRDVSGAVSVLPNYLNAKSDIIIDFGY